MNQYNSYFLKIIKYELLVTGIWPTQSRSRIFTLMYKTYGFVTKMNFLYFLVTLVLGFITQWQNLTKTQQADDIIFILSYSLSFWKVLLTQSRPIQEIMQKIATFDVRIKTDDELYGVYKKYAQFNFKLCTVQPLILSTLYVVFACVIVKNLILWNKLESPGILMFRQWIPFYQQKWFMIYLIMQLFYGFWGGLYLVASDGLLGSLMYFLSSELNILGKELERFGCDKMDNGNRIQQLRNLILRHKDIMRDVDIINTTYGWEFFLEFTVKSFHLSQVLLGLFEMTQIGEFSLIEVFNIIKFLAVFTQFLVLYYQANNVIVENANLSDSVYKSHWFGQHVEITKTVLIIMNRTTKTLKFEGLGLVILSNALTVKVVKAMFSYAVITTVQKLYNK